MSLVAELLPIEVEREAAAHPVPRAGSRPRRAWWRILASLATSAALVVVTAVVFRPHLLANDDATMAAFANGDYATRDWHLVFVHAIPGRLLVGLRRLAPTVPWYTWLLLGAWIVAWATAIYVGLLSTGSRTSKLLVGALIIACVPATVLQLTFTSSAIGLAVSGVVLLVAATQRAGRPSLGPAATAGALLIAGSMLRWHALLAVVVAFLPLLAAAGRRAGLWRSLAFATTLAAFAGGLHLVDRETYQRGAWKTFTEFNDPRGELHGTPRLRPTTELESVAARYGWSENDLWLFSMFMYADPDLYTTEAVQAIRDHTSFAVTDGMGTRLQASYWMPYRHLIAAGAVFCALACLRFRRWRERRHLLASSAWFLGVLALLAAFARLPVALGTPLLIGALLLTVVIPDYLHPRFTTTARRAWQRGRLAALPAGLVLLLALAVGWTSATELGARSSELRQEFRRERRALLRTDPEGTFVGVGSTFAYQHADPLSARGGLRNLKYLELGWPTFSPHYQRRLRDLGLGDVYGDIVWRPHTYLVAPHEARARLERYYRDHRGWLVRFRQVGTLSWSTVIWQAEPPTSAETGRLIVSDPRAGNPNRLAGAQSQAGLGLVAKPLAAAPRR